MQKPTLLRRPIVKRRELQVQQLASRLGVKRLEDWYSITGRQLVKQGGAHLLERHGGLLEALRGEFPEHQWHPWKFRNVPKGHWNYHSNRQTFLKWAEGELMVSSMEDWYNVTNRQVIELGGATLLSHFGNSLFELLRCVYSEHEWHSWRFCRVTNNYWAKKDSELRVFLDWLSEQLHVGRLEDWYRVSLDQIARVGSPQVFRQHGGISKVLQKVYPDHAWDLQLLEESKARKSSQFQLKRVVEMLFPSSAVYEDFHHPGMLFSSGQKMELDVYVPTHRLALEYQGNQHYQDLHVFGPQFDYSFRDEQKRSACAREGITLIEPGSNHPVKEA